MKFRFTHNYRKVFSMSLMCHLLTVASSYYAYSAFQST